MLFYDNETKEKDILHKKHNFSKTEVDLLVVPLLADRKKPPFV